MTSSIPPQAEIPEAPNSGFGMGRRLSCLLLAGWLLLAACAGLSSPTGAAATLAPPSATATSTAVPSATASPTVTLTPTPTLHPLSIQAMRERDYPGSEITIQQTLDSGSNYARYIASYLSEGLRINGLLTVPYGAPPEGGWPVIVFNHGYIAPDVYRTTERYVAYLDNLARNGYIVLRPDYRGHAESEGVARGAYGSPDYVVDVLNAVAAMRAFPQADPARVGMWGHSMGGYITLRAMVIDPGIRAGVIWAGVVASYPDLYTRWRRTPSPGFTATPSFGSGRGWRSSLVDLFGLPEENPLAWAEVSANSYLGDLSGPLQLHHGTADTSVPHEFSEILYQQVLDEGGTVEFYSYPGADHNLSGPFSLAMARTLQFYATYLRGP